MVDSNALISVIVPIYNIEQYVGFCIESIIKQTYTNLEIILVDDGSTDRCPALCDLYASKDSRIKVIHKANGGLVSARKAGVSIASGKYIGYVDGDDWIESDYYETMYKSAMKSGADIVCAGFSRDFFSRKVKCNNSVLDGLYEGDSLEVLFTQMMSYDSCFTIGITTYVWNKLFKSEIVKDVQLCVDEQISIGEDAAVTYPALLKAERVYICDNNSYHYRQREGSMLKVQADYHTEVSKIRLMYDYLSSMFLKNKRSEMLNNKLDNFALGYFIMRSGGIIEDHDITVFRKDFKGKRVAIVFAGSFGQILYNRLKRANYCQIVGWYDDDYWEYRRCSMDVDPFNDINVDSFNYIIIAKTDFDSIELIKKKLKSFRISEKKILNIDISANERQRLLKKFLDFSK